MSPWKSARSSTCGTVKASPRSATSLLRPCCQGGKICGAGCAATDCGSSASKAAASRAAPTAFLRTWVALFSIVEAGLLQLGDRRHHSGREHDAVDKMVGELGGHRFVRQMVGIGALTE